MKNLLLAFGLLCLSTGLVSADPDPIADGVKCLSTYDYGTDRTALVTFTDYVRSQDAAGHAKTEAALLPLLANATVPVGGKDAICRILGPIGSDASVPALAGLLTDPKLSHLAVYALSEIGTPAAKSALSDGLGKVSGDLRLALINAVGRSQIAEAIPALAKIATSDDAAQSGAAVDALAAIGTSEALQVLLKLPAPADRKMDFQWALIRAAAKAGQATPPDVDDAKAVYASIIKNGSVNSVRVAAAAGEIQVDPAGAWAAISPLLSDSDLHTRLDTAELTPRLSPDGITALLAAFPSLDPAVQVVIVNSFAAAKSESAEPVLKLAFASANPDVHLAAISGYGTANLPSSSAVLLPLLAKSGEEAAAATSLGLLTDPALPSALLAQLPQATGLTKVALLNLAADRRDAQFKDAAFTATGDADAPTSEAAFRVLEALVTADDLSRVVAILPAAKTSASQKSANLALLRALQLSPDKDKAADVLVAALSSATGDARKSLIVALSSVDSTKASTELSALLNDPSVDNRKEVIRVLSTAHNSSSETLLFQMASQGKENSEKILSLRGYLDTIQAQKLPSKTVLDDYKKAWPLAIRQEEKDAILAAVKNQNNADAKKLLAELSTPAPATTSAPSPSAAQ